jgi:hypothetical protein
MCDVNVRRASAVKHVMCNHRRDPVDNCAPDCIMHILHRSIYTDFIYVFVRIILSRYRIH